MLRIVARDGSPLRHVDQCIRCKVVDKEIAHLHDVGRSLLTSLLGLALGHDGHGDERHLSVGLNHLQVGPGTEGFHGSILVGKELTATTLHGRIDMSQEVVAVIDDGIVVTHLIVLVGLREVECGQALQVGRSGLSDLHQIATHFTKKHCTVGYDLHAVNDTQHTIDGVGGMIQRVVLLKLNEFAIGFEHVRATTQN